MRAILVWKETPPEKDEIRNVCYDVAFRPDGSELVCGIGSRVLIFAAADGELLHSLKGHKDAVYCVDYAANGKRFASGGADKTIIIWTSKGEGILKYSHNESIQALAYNPLTQQLASATAIDFGLWSPEQKSVAKHKVNSKVLTLSWTTDGQYLALGHFNGEISVRDKSGDEKVLIQRASPVWSLAWRPGTEIGGDVLAVGCWDGTLSFYQLSGVQIGVDKKLGFDPCSLSFFSHGEYLTLGGTDRRVHLYTKEGTKLVQVAERDGWVWSVKPQTKNNFIAVGCEDGSIAVYQLVFSTVHGLYQDRYAYRDNLADVIVQHLITEQRVCIKCRDYVKKIAVYKDKLAVQLPEKVVIYELTASDPYHMHYQAATKIQKKLDCNLLVVTSMHVILCQEKKLQSYSFQGSLEREWILESVIRYIKIVGGPRGREGLLVGLKSGSIMQIFVDNPFPISLFKHSNAVRCLDMNCTRTAIALVDAGNCVAVYDVKTKEKVFEEKGANSVAWNADFPDMLCYSGNGTLCIKTGNFPLHKQKLQGFVVGFKMSKVFCLQFVTMQTIDVPQSSSMKRYLEQKEFQTAYQVACLGVTDKDWRELAMESLSALHIDVAKRAYIRVRDSKFLDVAGKMSQHKSGLDQFLPEVLAYQGRYQEAARLYGKMGQVEKAMAMFSDLRQFDEAKRWAEEFAAGRGGDQKAVEELISRQAEWSEEVNDLRGAADMYIRAKKFDKAVAILGKHGWLDELVQVVRQLGRSETALLKKCAVFFKKGGHFEYARETLTKMEDAKGLVELYVAHEKWEDAFVLVKIHKQYAPDVHGPHALWLTERDRFDEARKAFRAAGQPQKSLSLLEDLAEASATQERFSDASYYNYQLAFENFQESEENTDPNGENDGYKSDLSPGLSRYLKFMNRAEIYHAYAVIHEAISSPFRTIHPSTLFNAARYSLMQTAQRSMHVPPKGVRLANILHVLASNAKDMGAYKLARTAYQRLQALKLPGGWQDEVDLQSVLIRSKPFMDQEDLLPVCYRCGTTNQLLNPQGDVCVNCGGAFIRSFLTFDHLPVIEFRLDPEIDLQEATRLIGDNQGAPRASASKTNFEEDAQVLRLDDTEDIGMALEDPFAAQMMVPNAPIIADRSMLRQLKRSEVVLWKSAHPHIPPRFFRIMDTSVSICCGPCGHFFEEDEFEMAALEHGYLPFSREPVQLEDNENQ